MLKAKKNIFLEKVFTFYNTNLLRRYFNSFNVEGLENLFIYKNSLPLIIYVNHSTWWDGLIVFQILRLFEFESFVMMEDKHLKNYPLFRRLGAFSVIREKPREVVKSLNYAAQIMKENNRSALVIFPQGKLIHNEQRPIHFFNGISRIVEKVGHCMLTSLSIRIEFLKQFKPEIFVKIGIPKELRVNSQFSSKRLTKKLAEEMTLCLDALKNDIVNKNTQNYQNILK